MNIKFTAQGRFQDYVLIKRPYLDEFLKSVSKFCIIYLYTHGEEEYAKSVVHALDPDQKILSVDRLQWAKRDDKDNKIIQSKDLRSLVDSQVFTSNCIILEDNPKYWRRRQMDRIILSKKFLAFYQEEDKEKEKAGNYRIHMPDPDETKPAKYYYDEEYKSHLDYGEEGTLCQLVAVELALMRLYLYYFVNYKTKALNRNVKEIPEEELK